MRLSEKQLLVAFGTNQPFGQISPEMLIIEAALCVSSALDAEYRLSGLFRTPCFPFGTGPDYVNAAAIMTLRHFQPPEEVLQILHQSEARFGRQRTTRWASRTLDIDLLAMGEAIVPDSETFWRWHDLSPEAQQQQTPDRLILPHPRLQDRAFVLVPLADVAADWRHPVLDLTVADMLAALPAADRDAVVRLNTAASD